MTEDLAVDPAPEPEPTPPVGRQIDDLTREIGELDKAVDRHRRDLDEAERLRRRRVDNLVELVGRPYASKLLGLTPRQLAGRLR